MNKECKTKEWDVQLTKKRDVRFKAGSELADKVNRMAVDINEETGENTVSTDLNMEISQSEDDLLKIALKKKSKPDFKAGADLSGRVNRVSVDLAEEVSEDSGSFNLNMQLESEESERFELSLKKRVARFKAGADLTEKVNLVAVDWMEERNEESETLSVVLKVVSSVCPSPILDIPGIEN